MLAKVHHYCQERRPSLALEKILSLQALEVHERKMLRPTESPLQQANTNRIVNELTKGGLLTSDWQEAAFIHSHDITTNRRWVGTRETMGTCGNTWEHPPGSQQSIPI